MFANGPKIKQKNMNNSTQKSIRNLSIAIFLLSTITVAYYIWHISGVLWFYPEDRRIVWNPSISYFQIAVVAGKVLSMTTLYVFCMVFLARTYKAIKSGEIFPKSNICLIRWGALISGLLTFASSNYDAAINGRSELMIDSNSILVPLIVLLFAGLYKLAHLAAKDSNLSI